MNKYQRYLQTPHWRRVRQMALERDGFRCQLDYRHTENLEVHHKTYAHLGKEHYHLGDLITLCADCHQHFHAKPKPACQPYKPLGMARAAITRENPSYRPPAILPTWPKGKPYPSDDKPVDGRGGVLLTRANLDALRGPGGAFTSATIKALGLEYPLTQGWMRRLSNKLIPLEQYNAARAVRMITKDRA